MSNVNATALCDEIVGKLMKMSVAVTPDFTSKNESMKCIKEVYPKHDSARARTGDLVRVRHT